MATWHSVREYISDNYKVADDKGTLMRLDFALADGRTHGVFLSSIGNDTVGEWCAVEAPVGRIADIDLPAALEEIEGRLCGGLSRVDEWLVVRDTFPIADLSIEELELPLHVVMGVADDLEQTLLGVDAF